MNEFVETTTEIIATYDWEPLIRAGTRILLTLFAFLIVSRLLKSSLNRLQQRLLRKGAVEGEPPSEAHKRVETLIRLLRQGTMLALWIAVALMILGQVGVQIGPLIAGAGIAGVAVGFGAQNLVRDVISGFFIILENQIRVGDVAIVNGTGGLVEEIRFRTTVLRDLSGVVHVFPNGTISSLSNMTNEWSAYVFDIGVAYKENTDDVVKILAEVGRELTEDPEFGKLMLEPPEIFGVDQFADSAVVIKGRIKTRPIRQWAVGREFLRRVKFAFDQHDIEIPFPHLSLYTGDATKPFDIRVLEQVAKSTNS